MAKNDDAFKGMARDAQQAAEQTLEKAHGAVEDYFTWLQKAAAASPWGNTEFNKELLDCANQNINAAFSYVQKLGQAKNFQDALKVQTEFMETQMTSFGSQAKQLGEACTKAASNMMKVSPFHLST